MKRYAAYKGKELLGEGTVKELAAILNVVPTVVYKMSTPTHLKQMKSDSRYVVKLNEGPKDYAAYRGDELLIVGTIQEIANHLDIKPSTVRFLHSPVYLKRMSKSKRFLHVVKLDEEEMEDELIWHSSN